MMNKKWYALAIFLLVGSLTAGYFLQENRDVLAAQWYFSNGPFPLISVEKNNDQVVVKLQVSIEQADMDVITYRNCPYQYESFWAHQTQDKIALAYFVDSHKVDQNKAVLNTENEGAKETTLNAQPYTQVAITMCDRDWSVSREINVLSALEK